MPADLGRGGRAGPPRPSPRATTVHLRGATDTSRPPGLGYPCADPAADIDSDTDVDLVDFAEFQHCYTGAGHSGAFIEEFCECFDADEDGDIDSDDTVTFLNCVSGPDIPANPACDG